MIIVTGATGNVGRHLIRELAGRRVAVRALAHTERAAAALREQGVEAIAGSFDDVASLRRALEGEASRLFLLTPPGGESMAEQQLRVVEVAAAVKTVQHIVKLSSITADEPTEARIVAAHRRVERAIEQSGMAWTHLRPNWFMQNELAQAQSVAREGVFYAPDVGRVSMVDVRDLAAVAARVLTTDGHAGRAYTLTGPEPIGYGEVAQAYSTVLGKAVRWQEISLEQARASMVASGLVDDLAAGFCEVLGRYRRGGATRESTPAIEQLTGRPPRSFHDFVTDHRSVFVPTQGGLS